jgi:hypothetical protein
MTCPKHEIESLKCWVARKSVGIDLALVHRLVAQALLAVPIYIVARACYKGLAVTLTLYSQMHR